MKLVVKYYIYDEVHSTDEFTDFDEAAKHCEFQFNLSGQNWDEIKKTKDLEKLCEFLYQDGIDAELLEV